MARKGNGTRKGRIFGKKRKTAAGISARKHPEEGHGPKRFLGVEQVLMCNLADTGFELISRLSDKLCLVPFQQMANGMFVAAPRKQLWTCYLLMAYGALTCGYKLWATAHHAIYSPVNVRLFICLASFLFSFASWSPSFALMLGQEDTMALANSWQSRDLFADMSVCIKFIAVSYLPPFIPDWTWRRAKGTQS